MQILEKYKKEQKNILPAVKEISEKVGYVSAEAVGEIANYFGVAPAQVFSVASFYDHINTNPPKPLVIKVCDSANCSVKKSEEIIEQIELLLGAKADDESNAKVQIKRESCYGMCASGPVVEINGTIFSAVKPRDVDDLLKGYISHDE